MMKKDIKNTLNKFLGIDKEKEEDSKIVITKDNSLIEHVNKKLVTSDGRELLREQLYETL